MATSALPENGTSETGTPSRTASINGIPSEEGEPHGFPGEKGEQKGLRFSKSVTPLNPHLASQTRSVLAHGNQKGMQSPSNGDTFSSLRKAMRAATVAGEELLESEVGENIIQSYSLVCEAGEFLAQKIAKTLSNLPNTIDVILDVRSGEYPGLGLSVANALMKTSEVLVKSGLKVVPYKWGDELPSVFREVRIMKVLIVSAARTPAISKKMETFTELIQNTTGISCDAVLKICSLVSLNDQVNTTEKHIDGLSVVE
jgi:hypothetical protein